MKNIIIILIFCLSSAICIGQTDIITKKVDSLSHVSRTKADLVLNSFDSIRTEKMLYSISDENYYVILRNGCCYKEYYVQTDSTGKIIDERILKTSKRNIALLAKAFELKGYDKKFITKVDNPTAVQGNPSYFVIKDVDGKRYGEYWLSVITIPIPIDKQLYDYLLTRLLKESTKE